MLVDHNGIPLKKMLQNNKVGVPTMLVYMPGEGAV